MFVVVEGRNTWYGGQGKIVVLDDRLNPGLVTPLSLTAPRNYYTPLPNANPPAF